MQCVYLERAMPCHTPFSNIFGQFTTTTHYTELYSTVSLVVGEAAQTVVDVPGEVTV